MRTKRTLEVKYSCSPRNAEVWADGEIIARQITGFNAAHLAACWNAIESIGGDPATVGELVDSLEALANMFEGLARVVLRDRYAPSSVEVGTRAVLAKVGR